MKKLLLAVGGAAMLIIAASSASAQFAAPPPEAFPPYVPDTSAGYWSNNQWRHYCSDGGECRLVRERILLSSGRVGVRRRHDRD